MACKLRGLYVDFGLIRGDCCNDANNPNADHIACDVKRSSKIVCNSGFMCKVYRKVSYIRYPSTDLLCTEHSKCSARRSANAVCGAESKTALIVRVSQKPWFGKTTKGHTWGGIVCDKCLSNINNNKSPTTIAKALNAMFGENMLSHHRERDLEADILARAYPKPYKSIDMQGYHMRETARQNNLQQQQYDVRQAFYNR